MTTSQTTNVPVNPLTGDLTTVTVVDRRHPGGKAPVPARIVAPGLALATTPKDSPKEPDRYALVHIPTGLAVIPGTCGFHALQGAEKAISVDVDWTTSDKDAMVAAIKAHEGFMGILTSIRFACIGRWCTAGDGPEPLSWSARCKACGWEWDEDYDEGPEAWPLTREEARSMADRHECEPEIELRSAETGEWASPWAFEAHKPVVDVNDIADVAVSPVKAP